MNLLNLFRRKPSQDADLKAFERELDIRLAVRRANRPQRSQAARKGWQTRKGMGA